jgi:hypothetical protein
MSMLWKLLRPQFWILQRRIRNVNRILVLLLILILALGGSWSYKNLLPSIASLFHFDQGEVILAAYIPFALIFFLAFGMLGIGDVLHQLYLTSELELMLVAPLPYRTIFLVKLLQSSRASFIPAFVISALLLLVGLTRGASLCYYLLVLILMLAAVALTSALIMILVISLARWLPIQKTQSWMPVAVALVAFLMMLFQQPATEWLMKQQSMITFLAGSLLDTGRLALVTLGLAGVTVVICEVAYRIFATSFYEGWNRIQEVPTRKPIAPSTTHYPKGITRWVQPLPEPLRSFLVKEWLELKRDPRNLIQFAQPLVLIVAIVLVPALKKGSQGEILQPLFFWLMVMLLATYLGVIPIGTYQQSIAQEGRKIALLRSAPISMSDVLGGKFWAAWTPMVLSWGLILLISGLWLRFPPWQIAFLLGITTYGLAGASLAAVVTGGLSIDFNAEELKQRIPILTSYLLMVVNLIYMLSITLIGIWLIVRLFPESGAVMAIRALADFGVVGWIFSSKLWGLFISGAIQVLFWISMKLLWNAAVSRLESWE